MTTTAPRAGSLRARIEARRETKPDPQRVPEWLRRAKAGQIPQGIEGSSGRR